jgi:predicted nucleotidyltransferase
MMHAQAETKLWAVRLGGTCAFGAGRRLVEAFDPAAIYLFGSRARGDATLSATSIS